MRKAVSKKSLSTKTMPLSPINFRMPTQLRTRLRRFAKERHLGESAALRVVVSEHLDEVESERELSRAERWQFQQAYATWQQDMRGELRTVPREAIEQVFKDALSRRKHTARRK